jgi:hypothetical protein
MAVSLLEGPGTAFDEWEQQICRTFVPLRARRREAAFIDFRGSAASTALGSVVLAEVTADEVVVERTPRLIRQDDPELYKFGLQVSGTIHGRRTCVPGTSRSTTRPVPTGSPAVTISG